MITVKENRPRAGVGKRLLGPYVCRAESRKPLLELSMFLAVDDLSLAALVYQLIAFRPDPNVNLLHSIRYGK